MEALNSWSISKSEMKLDKETNTYYHNKYNFAVMTGEDELIKEGRAKVSILKILEGFSYKEIRDILRSVEDKVAQHSRL